jgi:hypothetical protein
MHPEFERFAFEYAAEVARGLKRRTYVHPHQSEGHPVSGYWRDDAHAFEQAMQTTPFKKPSQDEHLAMIKEAREAYGRGPKGEAGRNLDWTGHELPLADDEDYRRMNGMLEAVGDYNDFDPSRVSKLLASLADTGHIDGYRPGREGSVAMYLHVTDGTDFARLTDAMRREGRADEIDPATARAGLKADGRWMRAWWD